MMLTIPSCAKNTEEPTNHEQAVQELKESQECCYLEYGVKEKVEGIDGIGDVEVELTFEPPWDKDMMSEAALLELGFI